MLSWGWLAVLLIGYVAVSVTGLVLLKSAEQMASLRFLAGGVLYAIGFGLWYVLLRYLPLSAAFPIAAGALVIGTQVAGHFVLGEVLSPLHLAGIALVITGVAVIFAQQ